MRGSEGVYLFFIKSSSQVATLWGEEVLDANEGLMRR